jgi:RNA polymerase sigma factor (sigma-70 family)
MRFSLLSALCFSAGSTPCACRGFVMALQYTLGGYFAARLLREVEPEELFLSNLDAIERAIAYVCHRHHLSPQDGEEFGSEVKTKLIEGNYAVLRKFEGRSTFSTYVTTVIQRLYFQWRVQMWGKWRPSAEAKRLGEKAITLERMLTRDGFTYSEALETLTTGTRAFTRDEVEALYLRLPERQPRPVLVPSVAPEAAPTVDPDRELFAAERRKSARKAASAVDEAIGGMDAESQLILRMRFWHNRKVPEIAEALRLDAKKLYKKIDRMLQTLRTALEGAGVDRDVIADLLDRQDHELSFQSGGKNGAGHSHNANGKFGSGENRVTR